MFMSTLLSKFRNLDELNVICIKETRESYEYKNGKATSNCIGYTFAALDKDLGQVTFFVSKDYLGSDSLLFTAIKDNVQFGKAIGFESLNMKVKDVSITLFGGRLYIKVFLIPNGNIPSGVLDADLEGFFNE